MMTIIDSERAIMAYMGTFSETLRSARSVMERGGFREAFTRIVDVPVSRPDELFEKIALMADAGIALRDSSILEYGLYLLEHHARDILAVPAFTALHWFNVANLRANILAVTESEGASRCWYERRQTAPARKAYKEAASACGEDDELKCRILTAHGRLLVGLGRDWEAFELFHEATLAIPDDEEALFGRTETLAALAGTAPALEEDLLREARNELRTLLENSEAPGRDTAAEELLKEIEMRVVGVDDAIIYPKNTVITDTEREHSLVMFSLKNRLYLTPCVFCRKCDRSVGDAAAPGAQHARVGGKRHDVYRRTAMIIGRLTERYRALRTAFIDHYLKTPVPDGSDHQPHTPEVEGWRPVQPATAAFVTALAGAGPLLEGMAACVALSLGRDITGPVRVDHIFGTPLVPGASLCGASNPALHAFWDLWADGEEGLIKGANLINLFGMSLASREVEELMLDEERLSEEALGLIGWIRDLIAYLIRMSDRDARGNIGNPPLWPLQPFVLPRHK